MIPISKTYVRHVWTLVFRCLMLAAALCIYIIDTESLDFTTLFRKDFGGGLLLIAWVSLVISMLYRIVPNQRAAIGARKHYACSYLPAPLADKEYGRTPGIRKRLHKGALLSALAWVLFNCAVLAALSAFGILTPAALVVIMLVYAVCDKVCILFFCPFRRFFMHNRCCVVCRIYNWDCIMICTPMILFPSAYSLSLLLLSVVVLLRWEIVLYRKPRFFVEECNENLRCERCEDRVCGRSPH